MSRLADDRDLWDRICSTLAQIADKNMPGWDAGEMTTAALREVDIHLGNEVDR